MEAKLPPITGRQLIALLRKDGWQEKIRQTKEGVFFFKDFSDGRKRTTVVPNKRRPLAPGTLAAILGPRQTGIGHDGLLELIERHGL